MDNTQETSPDSRKPIALGKKTLIFSAVLVLVLVSILGYLSVRPKQQNVAKELIKAQQFAAAGDYEKTEAIYKNLLSREPQNAIVQVGLINSISAQGNQSGQEKEKLKESLPYIEQALKDNPDDPVVLIAAGYAYETAGEYEKALEYYKKATEIAPEFSDAWFRKGHVLQFLNRGSEAQKDYEKAYKLNPDNASVLIIMGNKFASEGKLEEAYQAFIGASKNSVLSPAVKVEALTAASVARRYQAGSDPSSRAMDEALSLSKQAIDIDPSFSPALGAYGINLAIIGERKRGIEYMKKAIKENPRIARNYFNLGYVLSVEGKYAESISLFNEAIEKVDNDNTLVGETNKSLEEGLYLYELAKTYYITDSPLDMVMSTLRQSISLNPGMKNILKSDFQEKGGFSELGSSPEFLGLVNS